MLSDEMAERQRLEVALQAAKAQQDAIESSIDSSRAFLAGLPGQLRQVQSAMEVLFKHPPLRLDILLSSSQPTAMILPCACSH